MITWWIALNLATKAYFITMAFIAIWCMGFKYVSERYFGG